MRRAKEMIYYASRTGTGRNLKALKEAGFGLLVSRCGVWRTEGFRYIIDPGTWSDYQTGSEFDGEAFERLVDLLGAGADFIILPDIVAGGLRSLDLSVKWLRRWDNRRSELPLLLIAVQDGMRPADVEHLVGPNVGIFLGGSTKWKLETMVMWGVWCAERGIHYHAARINTLQRFHLAHDAGALSADGSSGTRFAKTIPLLIRGQRQPSLLSPRLVPA